MNFQCRLHNIANIKWNFDQTVFSDNHMIQTEILVEEHRSYNCFHLSLLIGGVISVEY